MLGRGDRQDDAQRLHAQVTVKVEDIEAPSGDQA
jgi:hypothetical protein